MPNPAQFLVPLSVLAAPSKSFWAALLFVLFVRVWRTAALKKVLLYAIRCSRTPCSLCCCVASRIGSADLK